MVPANLSWFEASSAPSSPPSNCQPQPDTLIMPSKPNLTISHSERSHWINTSIRFYITPLKFLEFYASIKTSSLPIFHFKTPTGCISRSPYGCNNVYGWKVKNFENKESRFGPLAPRPFLNFHVLEKLHSQIQKPSFKAAPQYSILAQLLLYPRHCRSWSKLSLKHPKNIILFKNFSCQLFISTIAACIARCSPSLLSPEQSPQPKPWNNVNSKIINSSFSPLGIYPEPTKKPHVWRFFFFDSRTARTLLSVSSM